MTMQNRRAFMKTVGGTVAAGGVHHARSTGDAQTSRPAVVTLQPHMDGEGLAMSANGVHWRQGRPSLTLLVGIDERRTTIRPGPSPRKGSARRETAAGPARDEWWDWTAGEYRWRWTLSRLDRLNGFTLRAHFYNGSSAPVRLAEFNLCAVPERLVTCDGDPGQWLLAPINGQLRVGHLGETLLPADHAYWAGYGGPRRRHFPPEYVSDGRWRIYDEVVTLYAGDGGRGLLVGPVGEPRAHVRLDFKVDAGASSLDIVSEMSGVVVDPGETRESQEVLILAEPYPQSLEVLFRWWAATHGARLHRGPVTGWCSWYDVLDKVSAERVAAVTGAIKEMREVVRMEHIQVDMGYERAWGDWRPNAKFPDGWPRLVEQIHEAGSRPGVWLASLAVSRTVADVYRHADWFQRRADARPISETSDGTILEKGPDQRYLDPTHPEAQRFLRDIIREKRREGFEYFKIDYNEIDHDCRFHHPKKTRFEAFRDLYRLYREEVGDSYLMACSEFTRAVMGYVDAVRVGWDSRASWDVKPICLLEALRCVGQSALANGVCFANDPDVTYLKPRERINDEELRTWHGFVGLLGGTMMISEPLDNPEHRASARRYEILVPAVPDKGWSHVGATDRDHQQFGFLAHRPWGDFAVVQLYNVQDRPASRPLVLGPLESLGRPFHVWSFWEEQYLGLGHAGFGSRVLAPHAAVVLRLTPVADDAETPVLVGTNLHIGMGSAEIDGVAARPGELVLHLNDGGARTGALFVHSVQPLRLAAAEGCSVGGVTAAGESIWRIAIEARTAPRQTIHLVARPAEPGTPG